MFSFQIKTQIPFGLDTLNNIGEEVKWLLTL